MINTLCNLCSMYDWSGKGDYGKQGKGRKGKERAIFIKKKSYKGKCDFPLFS